MEAKAFDLFYKEHYHESKKLFENLLRNARDSDTKDRCLFNIASCAASLGDYEDASENYAAIDSNDNDLLYNKALCAYRLGDNEEAIKLIDRLFSNCEALYPELIVKQNEMETLDDGRYEMLLQESHIVEAQNLKAAAMFKLDKDLSSIKRCLDDLPVKREDLLDCITLHNKAIYEHYDNLESTINKIDYLSKFWENSKDQPELAAHLPIETFRNLLMLYSMRGDTGEFNIALELMQTHKAQIEQSMTREEIQFFDIYFQSNAASSSDELVYRKLDRLVNQLLDKWGSFESRREKSQMIDLLLVVTTYEGTILWHNDQYGLLEKLLKKVLERVQDLSQNIVHQTNLAHAVFMSDSKFDECVSLYEDIVKTSSKQGQTLKDVDPQVLSGLCVSYVLTGRNNEAEALIKDIDVLEEPIDTKRVLSAFSTNYADRSKTVARQHSTTLCCVNLVIGTLYCVKYNYDFGLTRMFKSLEPLDQKLNICTWFYTKRCILSLLDCQCKQMICVKDDLLNRVVTFLIQCEKVGTNILVSDDLIERQPNPNADEQLYSFHGQNTIAHEAGYLRSIALTVIHD